MLERIVGDKRGRAWSRRLLGAVAFVAGVVGFGGTVACAYGPGLSDSCSDDESCRSRLGAGYYCDRGKGSSTGYCRRRTFLDGPSLDSSRLDGAHSQ